MSTPKKKTVIPNELKITINTSIPGFQTIKYTPNMTIKDISKDDKSVQFNPLVKLNQSTVNKIPEDLRIKEFFNPGLFESLLRFTGSKPVSGLEESQFYGIIDNNIKVTLDSIFPSNSVIYIGKKPYVIVDVEWSKGSWKIDTKQKPIELDSSKITDPNLYAAVVRDEIISGEQELNSLPENVMYGPNYSGPKNVINPPQENVVTSNVEPTAPTEIPVAVPTAVASGVNQQTSQQQNKTVQDQQIVPSPKKVPQITNIPPETSTDVEPYFPPEPSKPSTLQIQGQPLAIENKPLEEAELVEDNQPTPEVKLDVSVLSTSILKNFFKQNSYFAMLNAVFKVMNLLEKKHIRHILIKTTNVNLKEDTSNLSRAAYDQTVQGLTVYKNRGKGDCFFISIADAINSYNYNNPNTKIIHENYGIGNNIFTQAYLRTIVLNYILSSPNLESYKQNAIVNAEEMNKTFEKQIKAIQNALTLENKSDDITSEQYVDIANALYKNSDNFLVKNIYTIPKMVDEYYTPFKPLQEREIEYYIKSNDYWANEVALEALSKVLGLNIIPIERNDKNKKPTLRIPYANFSSQNNNWSRYLFLYYSSNHFEVISFSYKERSVKKVNNIVTGVNFLSKKTIIFNRSNPIIIPPMYILFIIFGSYYFDQTQEFKNQFTFFPEIMISIQESLLKIINSKTIVSTKMYDTFKQYFPNTRYKYPLKGTSNISDLDGGANGPQYNYPSPYYQYPAPYYQQPAPYYNQYPPQSYYPQPSPYPYQYGRPSPVNQMVKKDEQKVKSHVAYYITVDMELHPGTSLTPEELKNIKCRKRWNAVRKAYSDFTGKPYQIPPVYQQPKQPNQNKTFKNKEQTNNNQTRNNNNKRNQYRQQKYNQTRKQNQANMYGGQRSTTLKKY